MNKSFLFLGTGDSMGVPIIGCGCSVCLSSSLRNKRDRTCGLLEIEGKKILIDASPDMRKCCFTYGISHIDAILLTHYHEDHVGGLNDLRPFHFLHGGHKIPLFLSEETYKVVSIRFGYLMDRFEVIRLEKKEGEILVAGEKFHYFTYQHGDVQVTGWRHGSFAYVTDIKDYEKGVFSHLQNIDTLVLSAIHMAGSKMHFSLEEAIQFIQKVKPKKAFLTHISHEMDHETTSKSLPIGVELAYDGRRIYV